MKKRISSLFLTVLVCAALVFSGCSYTQTSVDSLLTAPRLSDQQNEVYAALEASVGKNIDLVYPQKGDFTSSFVINNIDSESTQEAIVFYESQNGAAASMPLRMNVLDRENGKWVSKYDTAIEADSVEKIEFININQKIYIIAGFNHLSKTEKTVSVFYYADGVLNQSYSAACTDFAVCDLNGDSKSELLTIIQSKTGEVRTVTAYLNQINSNSVSVMAQAAMDSNVTSYAAIKNGKLKDGTPAVYMDGLKGTNLCTEILAFQDKRLKNLIYSENEEDNLIEQTNRSYGSLSMDLDNDGVYEIPRIVPALGYEMLPSLQQQHLTEWYNYVNGRLRLKKTTYISYSLGYIFTMPRRWLDKVQIDYISGENEISFYDYENIDDYDSLLLTIKVVRRKDYQSVREDGYQLLRDNGMLMYTYKIYDTLSNVKVTEDDIINNFSLT